MINPFDFIKAVRPDTQPTDLTRMATVTQVEPLLIKFDGDTVSTPVPKSSSLTPWLGARVACRKIGKVWVAEYVVTTGASGTIHAEVTGGTQVVSAGVHQVLMSATFTAQQGYKYSVHFDASYIFSAGNAARLGIRHAAGASIFPGNTLAGGEREINQIVSNQLIPVAFERYVFAGASGQYTIGVTCNFYTGSGSLFFGGVVTNSMALRISP